MEFLLRARVAVWGAALLCGIPAVAAAPPSSHTTKHAVALTPWEQAQRARAGLEAQAEGLRTRAAYTRVLDQFRAIYHDNPRDTHAAEAVYSVAELLAEEGRDLEDAGSLRAAVGQYEFLRTQYPASPLGAPALLAEGRIEADGLGDKGVARAKLNQLMKEAPRSEAAKQARVELAGLKNLGETSPVKVVQPTHHDEAVMNGAPGMAAGSKTDVSPVNVASTLRDETGTSGAPALPASSKSAAPVRRGPLAQVTAIRHWSTATYTRVAIDLGDEVTFEAARVPDPDRLFFDLHGAKLDAALVSKTFDVTDDGFLKRIRAAQAGGDVTRVVLDVSDVSEYSAFLLPNPYRLIIDIHGRKTAGPGQAAKVETAAELPVAPAAVKRASAAANSSGLPAMAPTDGGEAVRAPAAVANAAPAPVRTSAPAPRVSVVQKPTAAKPVPNAVAVSKPQTATEVAAVSDSPGKVEATDAPTSKPIAVREVSLGSGARRGRSKTADTAVAPEAEPVRAADKTADGETSLIRALGLKIGRIVIDAGHGGHDSGTIGAGGIEEKDVVLDVALRLGKLLHERLGAEIIYTRSDDTFIPLETRTAIANKAQADLFLSIHANSSADATARGVETYYLNFTSDPLALDVAARENAVSGQSIHQLSDLVKKITLKDKIAESHEFAADVESSLYAGLTRGNSGLKDRGVKKAPFVVLIGANMPSILAEISFVTNPQDADQLRQPEYRERVAESLYNGVARYEGGLAGTRPVALKRASLQ